MPGWQELNPGRPGKEIAVQSRLIHEEAGQQTFVLVFETGDEAMDGRKRSDPESGLALIALDDGDARETAEPQGEASLPHVPEERSNLVGEQAQRVVEEEESSRSSAEGGAGSCCRRR
jgi:hypothetical protein